MSDNSAEVEQFITRWSKSGASERANYALFLSELCDLIGVERPDPSVEVNQENAYVIDRAFSRTDKDDHKSTVYLDLYKRGHFVLETKQGSSGEGDKLGHGKRGSTAWDKTLDKAYNQAREYIRDIPTDEGRPPFLMVCDVGHVIDIYAEFSGTGGVYLRYPDPKNHRIFLEELRDPQKRDLLRTIWTDPHSLDPSKHAAKVTREVADTLAKLAASLEKEGHDLQIIATFLQRLLFSLFAEDVGLLPKKSFEELLEKASKTPQGFVTLITQLWKEMATGAEFSTVIMKEVIHFNGGLFENPTALPLAQEQIDLLIHAAKQDWKEVEPAIFGTLLERALDPAERHKLGAHYTPRSYVERLIEPTLMEPLRDQWLAAKTAAALLHDKAEAARPGSKDAEKFHRQAQQAVETYHRQLTATRVLDPACGSANFLYVALARMKELEAEVLDLLAELGGDLTLEMSTHMVRPDHFHGLEINPRAASIAQLVLWIGYFQWHHKTTGNADTNERPLLPKQQTIECRDAVLDYDEKIPRRDTETGEFLTIWDGRSTKTSPITGKEIPDESKRTPLYDFINPKRTTWPKADYIIGNPPFLGSSRMRDGLGDGYTEALRLAWKKFKPNSWDFVMFWWHQAAELVRDNNVRSFGYITTNSIHQTFNRRCIEPFITNDKKPVSIIFAIPDHPWVDSTDGAAVRIAMTVVKFGSIEGTIKAVVTEDEIENGESMIKFKLNQGLILPNLKIGANLSMTKALESNSNLSFRGVSFIGDGFVIDQTLANQLLSKSNQHIIKPTFNARDITQTARGYFAVDCSDLEEGELIEKHPKIYQHLTNTAKPYRKARSHTKDGAAYYKKWWQFGKKRSELSIATKSLKHILITPMTAKHRMFIKLENYFTPDQGLIVFALQKNSSFTILSSYIHVIWSSSQGGRMGMGNDLRYNNSRCFETFPFPDLPEGELKSQLSELGEKLDAFRKERQEEHPKLTLTGMYNVLEKMRRGEAFTDKDKIIHDQGLITILKQIHDDIDRLTYEAYGWQDLWKWQYEATCGSCYDPETNICVQYELAPDTSLYEATAEYREKYEQILLQRLVDLNQERTAEEAQGKIRYLRPEFQNPDYEKEQQQAKQTQIGLTGTETKAEVKALAAVISKAGKLKWPSTLPQQVSALHPLIEELGTDPTTLSKAFGRTSKSRQAAIEQILQTLETLGQI